jgi:hypothetical protein
VGVGRRRWVDRTDGVEDVGGLKMSPCGGHAAPHKNLILVGRVNGRRELGNPCRPKSRADGS